MSQQALALKVASLEPVRRTGAVRAVSAGHVEASGPFSTIGDICEISTARNLSAGPDATTLAEVVAVRDTSITLIPLDPSASILPGARVTALPFRGMVPVGHAFAGRAVDALAQPIDDGPAILPDAMAPLDGRILPPMDRRDPDTIIPSGVKAIDSLLTLGRGQRIGVFAASGVGKTTLIRQLANQLSCDHCILSLVGERGREVEAIWREISAQSNRGRFTCVAATSDVSPALRARAVHQSLSLAEHWRSLGRHVVLIVDSVTRYAMALREIGLASGAPPTLRAYTPNVFAALPRLVERCGAAKSGGSITAVITVLSETDDVDDPIVEVMKSLLDGHIILSRQLAEQGRFPAIDVSRSVSRQAGELMTEAHANLARRALAQLSAYEDARIMIETGIYRAGSNPKVDEAMRARDDLIAFLKQSSKQSISLPEALRTLQAAVGAGKPHA